MFRDRKLLKKSVRLGFKLHTNNTELVELSYMIIIILENTCTEVDRG